MELSALLTSAGINIGLCALMISLYSLLRKQPENVSVYFGRRLEEERDGSGRDCFFFERLVPSPSWILKAWEYTEDDILTIGGLDAVVFLRILVFSIRIFSIAAVVCVFGVLPLNYYGQEMRHTHIPSESLEVFTIGNIKAGSQWLGVHCLALYIITFSACILLYFEYKSIARKRINYITRSSPNPSHFSVLVRAIPKLNEEGFGESVRTFFTNYHASSYLSHQMIYKSGKVQKLMNGAGKVYKKFVRLRPMAFDQRCLPVRYRCGLCGGTSNSFHLYRNEYELTTKKSHLDPSARKEKECSAAFVFFKTRYAAIIASQVLQSSNPMLWVTDLAPEPSDVYWSNLWIPYRQLWLRRLATLLASIAFMFVFILPVTFVQGLTQLQQLQQNLPFLKGILKKTFMIQLVTGYLPSVILMLFLYTVPPMMMLFSSVEGPISRSGRKKSACFKILCFNIWNIFFVNVLSGSVLTQLNVLSNPRLIPGLLAKAVPTQATFFITYILSSGWASLSSELMQLFALTWNFVRRYIFRIKTTTADYVPSFPYHTEVPRVLIFGLIGFTCAVLAPLILPFLLVYFFLSYVVYRNQILNVYYPRYESGGQLWPIVHNTTIFSLVLTQIIALGVFGIKKSPVASGFTIPLVICTLLFNEYCRQRFSPIFKHYPAQDLIEMDRQDEQSGRMEETHQMLLATYCQFPLDARAVREDEGEGSSKLDLKEPPEELRDALERPVVPDLMHPALLGLPVSKLQGAVSSLTTLITNSNRDTSI